MELSPIVMFVYNRPDLTKNTLDALKNNFLANKSDLFIFSDGSLNNDYAVLEVRQLLKNISGFKSVKVFNSPINKGLANSIIDGVSYVFKKYDRVIVLEDDLIVSPNFLNFMNEALIFYKHNQSVFSISGYTMELKSLIHEKKDYYLGYRASSWGWATWSRSWTDIDWGIEDYNSFLKSRFKKQKFNRGGSDMTRMLKNQMNKKINSWAIRWCYNQFKRNQYTVFPVLSKVINQGCGGIATHTINTKRFITKLDETNKVNFCFEEQIKLNSTIIREFKFKFSLFTIIRDKLLKFL